MSVADIALLTGLVIAIVGGAIQLGTLRNQITINTHRIGRMEDFIDTARIHMSNTNARWPDIERRINRLEEIVNHATISLRDNKK
jgi:hypothetical protein